MYQKLAITDIVHITEVEPFVLEIRVKLQDGSTAVLRMSAFTANSLRAALAPIEN